MEPMASLAFKIATDPFVGRLAFFRCYSGSVPAGSYVQNMRTGQEGAYQPHLPDALPTSRIPVDVIEAGDIGAAVGFKDIRTGDTLCDENNQIILESMSFPEPVIGIAVEPKTQADMDKMGAGARQARRRGSHLQSPHRRRDRPDRDQRHGRTAPGDPRGPHAREFKVECNQGAPQVKYKEAITGIQHREVYKKQTGGRGKFADIHVRSSHRPI
jgi:elongation factor G